MASSLYDNSDIVLVQNDKGVVFEFVIRDKVFKSIVDLQDAQVYLHIQRGKQDKLKRLCRVIDPLYGKCEYAFQEGDLSLGNMTYYAEVEVNYPDGSIVTSEEILEFYVREEIE